MAYIDNGKNSHLERLAYDEIRERRTWYGEYYSPVVGGYIGAAAMVMVNYQLKRPLLAHFPRTLLFAGLCAYGGYLADEKMKEQQRMKYARIKHYITLHPEDFPPYPPRIKLGDTLQPWIPRRPGW